MTDYKLSDPVFYFAYGSNMNPDRMRERGAHFAKRYRHSLPGYSLKFNKLSYKEPRTGCANIVPDKGGVVEGIVYEITVEGLYALDKFEGYPVHYDRVRLSLKVGGAEAVVKTYIAMPDKTKEGLHPARAYIEHLLRAKDFVSIEYYEFLKNHKTID